jgi:hypothetical protein
MSAFVCTRRHVAAVARFGAEAGVQVPLTAMECADLLLRENIRSVDHRYSETNAAAEPFTAAEIQAAPALSPVEALKSAACLNYQSCECDDYDATPAARLVNAIAEHARALGASNRSPAYERAPWGLDEFDPQRSPAKLSRENSKMAQSKERA